MIEISKEEFVKRYPSGGRRKEDIYALFEVLTQVCELVLLDRSGWEQLEKLKDSLEQEKKNLKFFNPSEPSYSKICGKIEILEELQRIVEGKQKNE